MSDSLQRRITLHDVAEHAGVSYQTVSRVVNKDRYVADETRQRVLESIAALDYHPSQMARGLRKQRSRTLALLIDGLEQHGPWELALNLQRAAEKVGYDVLLLRMGGEAPERIEQLVARLRSWSIDGIIANVTNTEEVLETIQSLVPNVPLLRVGLIHSMTEDGQVLTTERYGGRLAAQHLYDLGHRQFAEITGPFSWLHARERHAGCVDVLEVGELEPHTWVEGDWSAESGYQAARQLVESRVDFTALVVGNDSMALGAMSYLQAIGIAIPRAVSVVGFHDVPEARFFSPPLTTIEHKGGFLEAERSIDNLIKMIEHQEVVDTRLFRTPQLIVRQSTSQPRRSTAAGETTL